MVVPLLPMMRLCRRISVLQNHGSRHRYLGVVNVWGSDHVDLKDGGIPGDALFFRGYQIADGFFVQLGIVVKRWLFGR